jgi:hypothetical protein
MTRSTINLSELDNLLKELDQNYGTTNNNTTDNNDWEELDKIVAKFETLPKEDQLYNNLNNNNDNSIPTKETSNIPNKNTNIPNKNTNIPNKNTNIPNKNTNIPNKNTNVPNNNINIPNKNTNVPNKNTNIPNKNTNVPNNNINIPNKNTNIPNKNISNDITNDKNQNNNRNFRKSKRNTFFNMKPLEEKACGFCGEMIEGEHLVALGKQWHTNHFRCSQCNAEIKGEFFEFDNQPSCKSCSELKFTCTKCKKPIIDEYYMGNGKILHPDCLEKISCANCNQPIIASETIALDKHYHPECFTCHGCGVSLQGTFYNKNNLPHCESCANLTKSSLCDKCQQTISGVYIVYNEKTYHQNCFVCSKCNSMLSHESFYTSNGMFYCPRCVK